MHPTLAFTAADDIGLAPAFLRVTWSVRTAAGALRCVVGTGLGTALFGTTSVASCGTIAVGAISMPGPAIAGRYELTVRSIDVTGNLSAPVTIRYTIN